MKLILSGITAAVCLSATGLQAQSKLTGPYTLTVDVHQTGTTSGKLRLFYYNTVTKKRFTDSAILQQGKAVFKGTLDEPVLSQLQLAEEGQEGAPRRSTKNLLTVYLQPGTITVLAKDSLNDAAVQGSALQKDYTALKQKSAVYEKAQTPFIDKYVASRKSKDTKGQEEAEASLDSLDNLLKENVYKPFITANAAKSPVALYALTQYAGYEIQPDKVEPLYNSLAQAYRDLPTGKKFAERIATAKKTGIGQIALNFTQNDTLGNPVSLASFRGKYVLLDFWASWCGPCRAENPNVVKAFETYKDKGFTVLGVSLDQPGQKERWLKAIHDDRLTWTHVSDLQFWNNSVAQQYGIQAIPQNLLLDPQGKIIAKNIRGEELQQKLKQVLN